MEKRGRNFWDGGGGSLGGVIGHGELGGWFLIWKFGAILAGFMD